MAGMKGATAEIDSTEPNYGIYGRLHSDYRRESSKKS